MDDKGLGTPPLEPNQLTAGNYAMHAPEGAGPRPVGEWNTTPDRGASAPESSTGLMVPGWSTTSWAARTGRNVKVPVSGAEVDDYAQATTGRIGLQNAGEVTYRNIRIRAL